MSEFFTSIWAFGGLVLGFGFLIFVHELGHYLVAKWVGIRVTQFAIGFGHCVLSWRKGFGWRRGSTEEEYIRRLEAGESEDSMGETEYRLNWMPLGGYVKMLGQEDMNPDAASDDERSFTRKPIWARASVVSAGVVMNLIFGVIFFVAAFMSGVEFPPALVGSVRDGSPASLAQARGMELVAGMQGLRAGDRITLINGERVVDFADVAVSAALAGTGETLSLTIERDGFDQPLIYDVTPKMDKDTELLALGVGRPVSVEISELMPGYSLPPALVAAGIESGMRVVEVGGEPIERYDQYERVVTGAMGVPVSVVFTDASGQRRAEMSVAAEPVLDFPQNAPAHLLGFVPATVVRGVDPGSPAEKIGMQAGDVLARVGSMGWPSIERVSEIVSGTGGEATAVHVLRGNEIIDLGTVKPNRRGRLGIILGLAMDSPIVSRTLTQVSVDSTSVDAEASGTSPNLNMANLPAAQLNLNHGSRLLSINGREVSGYADIQRLLAEAVRQSAPSGGSSEGGPAGVTVRMGYKLNLPNSELEEAEVIFDEQAVAMVAGREWAEPLAGSPYAAPVFKLLMLPVVTDNPWNAAVLGVKKTHQFMLQTYVTLARLFQGSVKVSHLRGPVGITDEGTRIAKQGWPYLMFFLGLISVNLAVINFLPLPIVDGGLIVLLLIEKLKGSPVSAQVQAVVNYVGLALIGSVFLLTLFYDVARLLGTVG